MKRSTRLLSAMFGVAVAISAQTASSTSAFAAGGGGGGSKTAFGPGEHVIQLPPMWVPVNKHKKKKGKVHYAPISIFLTSKDGGITNMCYKLPYLQQAFLFEVNRLDIRMKGNREIITKDMGGHLLNVAIKTTDRNTVKKVEVISGTPHPTGSNQDMLALCR